MKSPIQSLLYSSGIIVIKFPNARGGNPFRNRRRSYITRVSILWASLSGSRLPPIIVSLPNRPSIRYGGCFATIDVESFVACLGLALMNSQQKGHIRKNSSISLSSDRPPLFHRVILLPDCLVSELHYAGFGGSCYGTDFWNNFC